MNDSDKQAILGDMVAMAERIANLENELSESKLSKMRLQLALCEVAQTLLDLSKQS